MDSNLLGARRDCRAESDGLTRSQRAQVSWQPLPVSAGDVTVGALIAFDIALAEDTRASAALAIATLSGETGPAHPNV